ncbi:MAG: hypothetical protein IT320_12005 [Anaerolineae bacterium]|nr:hypothetical protein [Anaerolineae bacterium]
MRRWLILLLLILGGCGGDAVIFAPTPPPPDLSPLRYQHPGGVFSIVVPRTWSTYVINTTQLAATAFSPPDARDPALTVAVVNLGSTPDADAFTALLNRYQSQIRADVEFYSEQNRQAMGDGSWRMTGIRQLPGGETQPINTFIQQAGSQIAVMDVVVPEDAAGQAEMQRIVNTLQINSDDPLEASDLSTLSSAKRTNLALLHLYAWSTAEGVFFITGEVANYGTTAVGAAPVRAVMTTAEGQPLIEAVDTVMGYGIPPGGFAPFSLRFGQGQPNNARGYQVYLGSDEWQAELGEPLFPVEQLIAADESSFDGQGRLIVSGSVENMGTDPARAPRAVLTVFDGSQNVIAAAFVDLPVEAIAPGESVPYQIIVPEIGGEPVSYIVVVQAH